MNNYLNWREKNREHLYQLYRIYLKKVQNFNNKIEYLNELKDENGYSVYNLPQNYLDIDYYESPEFIEKFIKCIYKSSSKKISSFDYI